MNINNNEIIHINNNIISRPVQFSIAFESKGKKNSGYKACLGLSDKEKNGIGKILAMAIQKASEVLIVGYRLNKKENSPFSLGEKSCKGKKPCVWHKEFTIRPQEVAFCILFPTRNQRCEEDRLEVMISTLAGEVLVKLSYDLMRSSHKFASKNSPTLSIKLPDNRQCSARNPFFHDETNNFLLKTFFINKPSDSSSETTLSNAEQREIAMILAELDSSPTDQDEYQQPPIAPRHDFIAPSSTSFPAPRPGVGTHIAPSWMIFSKESANPLPIGIVSRPYGRPAFTHPASMSSPEPMRPVSIAPYPDPRNMVFIAPSSTSSPGYGRPVFIHTSSTNSPGPVRTVLMAPREEREPYRS